MGIYDNKKDQNLSDLYKRAFSPEPIEISADIANIQIPDEFLEQFKRETEVTDEIRQKFLEVCFYLFTHNLSELRAEWPNGIKFSLIREAADDKNQDGCNV